MYDLTIHTIRAFIVDTALLDVARLHSANPLRGLELEIVLPIQNTAQNIIVSACWLQGVYEKAVSRLFVLIMVILSSTYW